MLAVRVRDINMGDGASVSMVVEFSAWFIMAKA